MGQIFNCQKCSIVLIFAISLLMTCSVSYGRNPQTPEDNAQFSWLATAAAESGDVNAISKLLAQGMSPDQIGGDGNRVLLDATMFKATSVVKVLIDAGANVNATGAPEYILIQGSPEVPNEFADQVPIFIAIQNHDRADFDLIMGGKPNLLYRSSEGLTALIIALDMKTPSKDNPDIDYILSTVERSQALQEGETPANLQVNDSLIQLDSGQSTIDRVKNDPHPASVIASYSRKFDDALANDNLTQVKTLLKEGMSPNQDGSDQQPIVFESFYAKKYDILKALLSAGANINTVTNDTVREKATGATLLIASIIIRNDSVFNMLMGFHPDVDQEDDAGFTALDNAIEMHKEKNTLDSTLILNTLQDVAASPGDGLQSVNADDGDLIAHVTGFTIDPTSGIPTINGTVKNLGKRSFTYVEVNAKFKDSAGDLIDTGLDNVSSLDSGETWKFSISTLKPGATEYDLTSLIGRH